MRSKLLERRDGAGTFALVFGENEEIERQLLDFAETQGIGGASLSAIGAFSAVTLGYFDREAKQYRRIPILEQVEVLSFAGNIARAGDQPKLHAHIVVGKSDGSAHGGHFLDGRVWPTLEMILTETPEPLRRVHDAATGLALIDLTSRQNERSRS
jgi:hypothetical protein